MHRGFQLVPVLLAVALSLPGQPKPQPKPARTAGGVFIGRSGKPMAGARLFLCSVAEDAEVLHAKVRLLAGVPTATADKDGRFQFTGFSPGTYTIVYLPAGSSVLVPNELSIKSLAAYSKSIAPLLRNTELGTGEPYEPRPWGQLYTLMKGHTFRAEGPSMRIWNATIRRGQAGPYLEMRRGAIWLQRLEDKGEIKFSAWSF